MITVDVKCYILLIHLNFQFFNNNFIYLLLFKLSQET